MNVAYEPEVKRSHRSKILNQGKHNFGAAQFTISKICRPSPLPDSRTVEPGALLSLQLRSTECRIP
jgi:hypothetical protein